MTRDQAINYLYCSGMSDEQVNTVVEALSQADGEYINKEDAISRQALLDAFGFSEKTRKYGGDHSGYNTMMLYEIQDMIESAPSVNPQKIGHWIWQTENIYRCSECGEDIFVKEVMNVPQYKCCPMCMAKMVEPQESEEV